MKKVEEIDIFTLIGLTDLTDEVKNERLIKMQEVILTDFFKNDLKNYLSDKDVEALGIKVGKGIQGEEFINKVSEYIPNFNELLYKKSQEFKIKLAINQIRLKLDINQKKRELFENNLYPKKDPTPEEKVAALEKLEKEKTVLTQVINNYEQNKWEEGSKLLATLKHYNLI